MDLLYISFIVWIIPAYGMDLSPCKTNQPCCTANGCSLLEKTEIEGTPLFTEQIQPNDQNARDQCCDRCRTRQGGDCKGWTYAFTYCNIYGSGYTLKDISNDNDGNGWGQVSGVVCGNSLEDTASPTAGSPTTRSPTRSPTTRSPTRRPTTRRPTSSPTRSPTTRSPTDTTTGIPTRSPTDTTPTSSPIRNPTAEQISGPPTTSPIINSKNPLITTPCANMNCGAHGYCSEYNPTAECELPKSCIKGIVDTMIYTEQNFKLQDNSCDGKYKHAIKNYAKDGQNRNCPSDNDDNSYRDPMYYNCWEDIANAGKIFGSMMCSLSSEECICDKGYSGALCDYCLECELNWARHNLHTLLIPLLFIILYQALI